MKSMFWTCSSLKRIDLSNFNSKNAKNMFGMFSECKYLIELKLSNTFYTENVTTMNFMFSK